MADRRGWSPVFNINERWQVGHDTQRLMKSKKHNMTKCTDWGCSLCRSIQKSQNEEKDCIYKGKKKDNFILQTEN